jgi:hypothetical protein
LVWKAADKSGMIALGLVRVGLGESCNRAIKHITSTQVTADLRRVAGAGMGASKGPPAKSTIFNEAIWYQGLDIHRQLHVP